jgi:Uma2 family endonuclease
MDDDTVVLTRHKLDVADYYRMAEAGILRREDRVELIDGEIIDKAPISQDHAASVNGLGEALVMACAGRAIVSVQNPIRLDQYNEPEPDFAVFRLRADRYRTGERPGSADALLLVEVSDTSLRFDRQVKLPLYARTGVPEYWIVDLTRRVLDCYREPSGDGYALTSSHREGDSIALALAPEIVVPLTRVFD